MWTPHLCVSWLYWYTFHSRTGLNLFSYFVFLYNGIVGFVAAIIRVLFSMLFGTLLLFRLDQNIMMDGFKFADKGKHREYQTWPSFIRIHTIPASV